MLSKVLSKETCAKCRFCCSFRRCSLWETPLFPQNECEKLSKDNEYGVKSDFQMQGEYGQMKLLHKYCTQDSEEEAACDYLDAHKGCILSQEDKPFDCKIWPLRIMKDAEHLVIALTPTCKEINKLPVETVKEFVQSGIGEYIRDKAMKMPDIIKEYRSDFPVIMTFSD